MRVLVCAHGHPRLSPGGGEHAAYALHQAIDALPGASSFFLAAADGQWIPSGCDLTSLGPKDWLIRRSGCGFFHPTAVALDDQSELARVVCSVAPTVVHLHHFLHLGIDLIYALRRWCPDARFVLTLHEFLALCPFNGQLLKRDGRLCGGPLPMDCQQCLPERSAADLLVRDQMVIHALAQIDVLISPSKVLRDLFLRWSDSSCAVLPPIALIENLLPPVWSGLFLGRQFDSSDHCAFGRKVFGYFGQLQPSKGIDLLLEAWQRVVPLDPEAHLVIHGNLPELLGHGVQSSPFIQRLKRKIELLSGRVSFTGRYEQDQVPALMAAVDWVVMASRWLENSPVVIQEARACGRPLLVPDQGGMAEKVRHGVDGLHYQARSSLALSQVMLRCCREPNLWSELHASQAGVPDQAALLETHLAIYAGAIT